MSKYWVLFVAFNCAASNLAVAGDSFFQSRRSAPTSAAAPLLSGGAQTTLSITVPRGETPAGATAAAGGSATTKDACETGEDGVLDAFVQQQSLSGKFCSVAKQCVNCCGSESRFDSYRATCGSIGGNFGSTTKSDTVCEGDGGLNYLNEWLERAKAAGKSNCSTTKTCGNCCGDGSKLDSFFAFCT